MRNIKKIIPFYNATSSPPSPAGDLFVENFSPQKGTYTDTGTAVSTITSGNMSITGNGAGNFTVGQNYSAMAEVMWSGNNWYHNSRVRPSTAANGQVGIWFGIKSVNSTQPQNVYWGIYFASPSDSWEIAIFNSGGNSTLANSATNLTLSAGQWATLEASFIESIFTVTATNESTSQSVSTSYTFDYHYPQVGGIKPNTGQIVVGAPMSPWDISGFQFGSDYLVGVDRVVQGDSISSGYYQLTEAQRFMDVYAMATGKTFAIFAGAGDRSIECANAIALSYYKQFKPKKVLIFCGTNNPTTPANVVTDINTMISSWTSVGIMLANIYVAEAIPRDGVNLLPLNAAINAMSGVSKVQWYSTMEDSLIPGNLSPTYSDETVGSKIHPNALGASVMSAFLISIGF